MGGAFHSAQTSGNSGQKSNGREHFGSVRPDSLGSPLKIRLFLSVNAPCLFPSPLTLYHESNTYPWGPHRRCVVIFKPI